MGDLLLVVISDGQQRDLNPAQAVAENSDSEKVVIRACVILLLQVLHKLDHLRVGVRHAISKLYTIVIEEKFVRECERTQ